MLFHSGVLASSKSASHTLAPELSALMVIFRSVGPVISTRRSSRPGAGSATRQVSSSPDGRVSGRKSSVPPVGELSLALGPRREQLLAPRAELALEGGQEAERLGRQDLLVPLVEGSGDLHAFQSSHLRCPFV